MRWLKPAFTGLLVTLGVAHAQDSHTHVRLLLSAESARAGETVLAGIQLRMDPGWHTYWKNPGESGIATEIHWQLPQGILTNDIQWPVPQKLVEQGPLTTYVYTNQVILLVPLKLATDLPSGSLTLRAQVSWLECQVECVQGKASAQATLDIGSQTKPSKDAALLTEWQKQLPQEPTRLTPQASWEGAGASSTRKLLVEWSNPAAVQEADFFPDPSQQYEVQARTEKMASKTGVILLRKEVKKLEGDWPGAIPGLLVQTSGTQRTAYRVDLVPTVGHVAAGTAAPPLWLLLVYGFIGGLILNVMPCVLPVIALKILSFVSQAKEHPGQVRKLGLVYTIGVLVSYLALAGLVIGLKAAGHQAGWGMQFSNPHFVVLMTILVTLVALNLFGLFEVNPGGAVLTTAGTLTSRKGAAGAFFNGVLATVLATSCTAAYLSLAVGFAFSQSAGVILLTLLAVGLGMASPYLVLSWFPGWLKFLPKPGPWMGRFKIAMGFPMLATVLWLLNLLPDYYGDRAWWLGLFLVILALAAWIFGEFAQRGRSNRGAAIAIALAVLVAGYQLVLEGRLNWRAASVQQVAKGAPRDQPRGIPWQPWSPAAVAAARSEGRPILIDFTADWCLTCNSVVKPALENSEVQEKIAQSKTVALLGDYTHSPQEITEELKRFGRAGVPMVLVYPKSPDASPMVLPDPPPLSLPSYYSRVILDALNRANE